jgi:hypothetical protein
LRTCFVRHGRGSGEAVSEYKPSSLSQLPCLSRQVLGDFFLNQIPGAVVLVVEKQVDVLKPVVRCIVESFGGSIFNFLFVSLARQRP